MAAVIKDDIQATFGEMAVMVVPFLQNGTSVMRCVTLGSWAI
jgi:hypothetical protein